MASFSGLNLLTSRSSQTREGEPISTQGLGSRQVCKGDAMVIVERERVLWFILREGKKAREVS